MNGEVEPIGKGNPRRLFHGDMLRMGDFEIEIRIDRARASPCRSRRQAVGHPDHIEQFVDEELIKTGMQLLDEEEITGDDEFQSALFGDRAKTGRSRSRNHAGIRRPRTSIKRRVST